MGIKIEEVKEKSGKYTIRVNGKTKWAISPMKGKYDFEIFRWPLPHPRTGNPTLGIKAVFNKNGKSIEVRHIERRK